MTPHSTHGFCTNDASRGWAWAALWTTLPRTRSSRGAGADRAVRGPKSSNATCMPTRGGLRSRPKPLRHAGANSGRGERDGPWFMRAWGQDEADPRDRDRTTRRTRGCIGRKLTQAAMSKAFAGELVPTEAELGRAEWRDYEVAEQLLERIPARAAAMNGAPVARATRRNARRRVHGPRPPAMHPQPSTAAQVRKMASLGVALLRAGGTLFPPLLWL